MSLEEYKAQERARLEKEDKELERQEKELEAQEAAGANSVDDRSEYEDSEDAQEGQEYEESEYDEDNPEDSEDGEEDSEENSDSEEENQDEDESNEDDESEENEESDEDKESEEDKESDEDKNEKDGDKDKPEKVDSESRKNLGPNRGQDDKNDKPKDSGDKARNPTESLKNKAADKLKEKIGANEHVAKAQQLATNAIAAAKGFVSGIAFIGKLLVNPVFWAAIAAVIVLAVIISMASVIGGNDYNKACDSNGVGSVNVADDADDFTRQAAIASWLMNTPFNVTGGQPMTKEQAAGVLGNLMLESYMANPKAIQGDHTVTEWQTCDNDCILSWGGSGKAIGLVQWMGNRRIGLAKFAKSEGTQWYDLTTQLKYLKMELDGEGPGGSYDMNQLVSGGFGDPNKTLEDYTWIWQNKFERAGESRTSSVYLMREQYAQEFYSRFDGSGVGGGSLATQCVGGAGSIDASNLVQLALDISYTREEKRAGYGYGSCGALAGCGQSFSKPEYIAAKKLAEETTGADPFPGLTASCDRMAATLYRLTGVDENFPWGDTGTQINYMNDPSNGWVKVSCQERQPGDALAKVGHIMVYIGMIDGRDTIASASIRNRSAHLSDLSCKADGKFYADGMAVQGWRKVN